MNKIKNTTEIVKLKSILVTNDIIDTDNIISGVSQANTQLFCGEAADDDTAVNVILDDFTITKLKGDLFRFMRRGTDYYAIHVRGSVKLRVSMVFIINFSVYAGVD